MEEISPEVLLAIRVASNSSTKSSPFELVCLRDPILPQVVVLDTVKGSTDLNSDVFSEDRKARLQAAAEQVSKELKLN